MVAMGLLSGELVCDSATGALLEIADPPSILVTRRERLDDRSRIVISRIALDGRTLWSRADRDLKLRPSLGNEITLAAAAHHGSQAYLVFNPRAYTVVALNVSDGSVAWRL
jgi:hypothetical protein